MRNLCLYMSSWPFLRRTLIDVACPAETGSSAQVDRLPVKGPYRSTAYFLLGTPLPETRPPACVGASPRALGRHLVAERGDALAPSPHSRRPPGSRTPSSPTPADPAFADPAFADPQTCAPLALRSHSWHRPAGARGAAAGAELRGGRPLLPGAHSPVAALNGSRRSWSRVLGAE